MITPGRTYKTEGIILKRRNSGEVDRVLTVFTRHYGKITVIAKGVRRITSKRAPSLELFTYTSLLLYQGKTFDIVTDATTLERFQHLRRSLHRIAHAYLITELLDRLLPEHEENVDIFQETRQLLRTLDDDRIDRSTLEKRMDEFKISLVVRLGFLPKDRLLTSAAIDEFIENLTERKLKSKKIFNALITIRKIS